MTASTQSAPGDPAARCAPSLVAEHDARGDAGDQGPGSETTTAQTGQAKTALATYDGCVGVRLGVKLPGYGIDDPWGRQ